MRRWLLNWRHGSASVRAGAGMLWDCEFLLPSGRRFVPFARAPWADDPALDPGLPAHMRHLGGEFVCVPFGIGGRPHGLLPEWDSPSWACVNPQPHGLSADAEWSLLSADPDQVTLRLEYPAESDVEFLTRRVSVDPAAPALNLELAVHARRATRQPIGLHPIARLPDTAAALVIDSSFEFGMTYPALSPPGISRVGKGQRFSRLNAIPDGQGGCVDYSSLPKQGPTEEMLMLCGVNAPVTLRYTAERVTLRLSWDTRILPCCLLWPSDLSIREPPWGGRFRGLGIEPVAAVFDAARELALENNPLAALGVATCVAINRERPLVIRYRIEAEDAP